ncbi:MAG: carbamoyl-phosphate synthase large subunit [Clostridia bacterium]|nr:carbamoyl-phosphate synthase large subunit [Clostridia bacterium]
MKKDIKKVLILGSGPVVIGQSAEFDYSAVQACRAFKDEGISVVMINSNPAAVSLGGCADSVYIEPLNVDIVKRVILEEKPDAILPTVGGDLGLEIALSLHQNGVLHDNGVELLCVTPELIDDVQNTNKFRDFLARIGEPSVASKVVGSVNAAVDFADEIGLPVIIRPAYSLGGRVDEFCYTAEQLQKTAEEMIAISPLHQIRIEKCISGWKELEYEVVRDCSGNCICVSSMENLDPVGIHTGDSIIVTPAQTLSDSEGASLRAAALKIVSNLGVTGSCNVQFALKPDGSEYAVLEVDPRVSRSSAFVSKATGYPIAEVAARVAIGYNLFEIKNEITGCTTACNEPAIDYCCVKFPKWSFENFDKVSRTLGTSMRSTGETIAVGTSFELAFMKAVRSINTSMLTPSLPKFNEASNDEIIEVISRADNDRIFAVYEALRRGVEISRIHELTKIDCWFLSKLNNIAKTHNELAESLNDELYLLARNQGFTDEAILEISGILPKHLISPNYKMIDTCAAEFDAVHPYFYSAWDEDDEATMFADSSAAGKRKVMVIGSGPSKVGQGSELEFCNVHCLDALKSEGCYTVCVNNNPEAVSTDYKSCDRLFIEPLSFEDIKNVADAERPWGVIVQFAGENSFKLARKLEGENVKILGADSTLLNRIKDKYSLTALLKSIDVPFTADRHLYSIGLEVDIISDGEDYLIPAISEHIERSGDVHAGDSISVCPAVTINEKICGLVEDYAKRIAEKLSLKGILNIQFALYDNMLYVVGISAGSFHNIPYVGRATGIDIIDIAVKCMLGKKLKELGCPTGLYSGASLYAVRVPVFSFDKLSGADTRLGEQMKSTGEVLGIAENYDDALLKALVASGMRIKRSGAVLFTVRNSDKQDCIEVAEKFLQLDFKLYATSGTAKLLNSNYVASSSVHKLHEESPTIADIINSGKIVYVVSTSEKLPQALEADRIIRRLALEKQIPVFTHLDTANALARCLENKRSLEDIKIIDIKKI